MRSPFLLLVLCLACGKTEAAGDGGADAGDAGAADGAAGCIIFTCDGSALCEVDAACPVGDGCNSCVCKVDSTGYHALCSGHPCSCTNPADF